MKMNQRVYGVVGIKSIMSNWNADMTGNQCSLVRYLVATRLLSTRLKECGSFRKVYISNRIK